MPLAAILAAAETARLTRHLATLCDAEQRQQYLGALIFPRVADLQRAVMRVDLPEADRQILAKRFGDIGGVVEADSNIVNSVTRSALSPVQTLTHLLKLALGETAPLGPASAKAKEAALKLGKSPDIRADLAKAPELVERLRPLMMAS